MVDLKQPAPGGDATAETSAEKRFAARLRKAGWHTYRDEESGRVVTNAYPSEREKLEKISGMPCEVVSEPHGEGTCARIGPVRTA